MTEYSKAIVVGVKLKNDTDFDANFLELGKLAVACEMEPIQTFTQNLDKFNPVTYLGPGKLEELKEIVEETGADLVIFEDELSPTQLRNIDEILQVPILDRTSLILEIFSQRAKTKEAKLQVEKARLQYLRPRLIGAHQNLGRQGGGSGLKNRGSGESKLELDKRIIEKKISDINQELKDLKRVKSQQRKKRDASLTPQVSLIGYTNAGKSTIMNAILEKGEEQGAKTVLAKDMLFATLDTTSRRITTSNNQDFILSDTVGFINKLPKELLRSFETTLEEVVYADLILNIMDISDANYGMHKEVTLNTLQVIGCPDIPILNVYNKIDRVEDKTLKNSETNIYISARKAEDIEGLIQVIQEQLYKDYEEVKLLIPYASGDITSYLLDNAPIVSQENTDQGVCLELLLPKDRKKQYQEYWI